MRIHHSCALLLHPGNDLCVVGRIEIDCPDFQRPIFAQELAPFRSLALWPEPFLESVSSHFIDVFGCLEGTHLYYTASLISNCSIRDPRCSFPRLNHDSILTDFGLRRGLIIREN